MSNFPIDPYVDDRGKPLYFHDRQFVWFTTKPRKTLYHGQTLRVYFLNYALSLWRAPLRYRDQKRRFSFSHQFRDIKHSLHFAWKLSSWSTDRLVKNLEVRSTKLERTFTMKPHHRNHFGFRSIVTKENEVLTQNRVRYTSQNLNSNIKQWQTLTSTEIRSELEKYNMQVKRKNKVKIKSKNLTSTMNLNIFFRNVLS